MATMNFSLPYQMKAFVEAQTKGGKYAIPLIMSAT